MKLNIEKKNILKVFAELTFIVIGILLAFQIENWNEERKQQQFAQETLNEISASLRADRQHIESRIRRLKDIADSMAQVSAYIVKIQLSSNSKDTDSSVEEANNFDRKTLSDFKRLRFYLLLELKTGSYETLKVTGLNLIKNSKLRHTLIDIYDYEYPRMHWFIEQEFNHPNKDVFWPAYYTHINLNEQFDTNRTFPEHINETIIIKDDSLTALLRLKYNKSLSLVGRLEALADEVDKLIAQIPTTDNID